MVISANTKIATIIKHHSGALDAIISVNSKFEKLRNPLLRKIMAGRTSIAMAAKIGGCSELDFFARLKPLGFEIDAETTDHEEIIKPSPDFMLELDENRVIDLDVRPVIASGNDPLKQILTAVKSVQPGEVLRITNSFEPTPLIGLLEKQGFSSHVVVQEEELVQTYFYRNPLNGQSGEIPAIPGDEKEGNWVEILSRFSNKLVTIDVREMEMPLPMHSILEGLDQLPLEHALFVYHKRIPVFLLPLLEERNFDYRIKTISETEVFLLIFRN